MLNGPIPPDLCLAHQKIARDWLNNHYDWRDPSDWPAGMSAPYRTHIQDNRTSHEEREKRFDEKNQQQIDMVIQNCRSGRSPQCSPRPAPPRDHEYGRPRRGEFGGAGHRPASHPTPPGGDHDHRDTR